MGKSTPAGNVYPKYKSKNPLIKFAVENFLKTTKSLVNGLKVSNILEVGCGEGYITNFINQLKPDARILGTDIDRTILNQARGLYPNLKFDTADAENLPFESSTFDLVVACEVLEHLENPQKAMKEIARVSSKYGLFSIPAEPLWRILNALRGAYLKDFGNTPGHINHWRPSRFQQLVSDEFKILEIKYPLPWIMILAEVKKKKGQPQ